MTGEFSQCIFENGSERQFAFNSGCERKYNSARDYRYAVDLLIFILQKTYKATTEPSILAPREDFGLPKLGGLHI